MSPNPDHSTNLNALRRIEGQVRGIQRMVEEKQYCIDILTQLTAIRGAIRTVEENILKTHFQHCVSDAIREGSEQNRQQKLDEIIDLIHRMRKK